MTLRRTVAMAASGAALVLAGCGGGSSDQASSGGGGGGGDGDEVICSVTVADLGERFPRLGFETAEPFEEEVGEACRYTGTSDPITSGLEGNDIAMTMGIYADDEVGAGKLAAAKQDASGRASSMEGLDGVAVDNIAYGKLDGGPYIYATYSEQGGTPAAAESIALDALELWAGRLA